ncbi:Hypothetical Protein RradSPS_1291 [Rubrobacter radiotolerans]|uniref:Uncharacterized protein n=1 Tax=Rubrobacter radiotolerans TaxID=42256 RepID=A0A023X3G2_RUBRA|nr:hypothetical protein [Rubrobacter radiotolerans]AHY46574.1 Hypothetical Protein RradSPS_1291 [Rubrobacter radiotolerans]MDX5893981.1 hypothetical protein [Rubrobacter radiotolerans]SMC04904.1 aldehyde dehydrogenase family protein [Rubrobacter radiotolerans DSM 5868]
MARGAIKTLRETIVREAVPAARAAVTVIKRHGGRAFQDWTREYGKERRKAARELGGSKGSLERPADDRKNR